MDEEKRDSGIIHEINVTIEALTSNIPNEYVYFLPSPNKGKRLMIRGNIGSLEAAYMACLIWSGEKTVADFPEMEEIDTESEGYKWVK